MIVNHNFFCINPLSFGAKLNYSMSKLTYSPQTMFFSLVQHSTGRSNATSTPSSSTMSTTPTLQSASTTQGKTCYQAVRADGIPVCLFCSGPVEFADKLKCSDWDKRFCSHDCKKEYQVTMFLFGAHCY